MGEKEIIGNAIEHANPFSIGVYGFLVLILISAVIFLGRRYIKREKLQDEMFKSTIEALTLFTHEISPEKIMARDEMLLMKIERMINQKFNNNE